MAVGPKLLFQHCLGYASHDLPPISLTSYRYRHSHKSRPTIRRLRSCAAVRNNRCQFTFLGPETAGKRELTPIILPFILRHVKRRGFSSFHFDFGRSESKAKKRRLPTRLRMPARETDGNDYPTSRADSPPPRVKCLARRVIITRHDRSFPRRRDRAAFPTCRRAEAGSHVLSGAPR